MDKIEEKKWEISQYEQQVLNMMERGTLTNELHIEYIKNIFLMRTRLNQLESRVEGISFISNQYFRIILFQSCNFLVN